jgi:hypothetical protein
MSASLPRSVGSPPLTCKLETVSNVSFMGGPARVIYAGSAASQHGLYIYEGSAASQHGLYMKDLLLAMGLYVKNLLNREARIQHG